MDACESRSSVGSFEEGRERIYYFLATLLSHPDQGGWGRVLVAAEQRQAIATADAIRARAEALDVPILKDELPAEALDLRCLVLELCQPLEHLKAEYERVLGGRPPRPGCSPYELDHRCMDGATEAEALADLAGLYRSFGFAEGSRLPLRPDHVAYEMEFMGWLVRERRRSLRMAAADAAEARRAALCDLAQHTFFGDHLAAWVASFGAALRRFTGEGYFEPLGRFLSAWIPLERLHLQSSPRREDLLGRRQVPVGA